MQEGSLLDHQDAFDLHLSKCLDALNSVHNTRSNFEHKLSPHNLGNVLSKLMWCLLHKIYRITGVLRSQYIDVD